MPVKKSHVPLSIGFELLISTKQEWLVNDRVILPSSVLKNIEYHYRIFYNMMGIKIYINMKFYTSKLIIHYLNKLVNPETAGMLANICFLTFTFDVGPFTRQNASVSFVWYSNSNGFPASTAT